MINKLKALSPFMILFLLIVFFAIPGKWFPNGINNESQTQVAKEKNNSPFNQETHSTKGFGVDAARVDSQITLRIPEGKAGEIYSYLKKTYSSHSELLKKSFPSLNLRGDDKIDISKFTDEYFDTPNLDLYKTKNSARHRSRINTVDATDRKNGRELVQMKATPPGRFDMREELKFKVKTKSKAKDPDDLTPLLGLVNKSKRADFKEALGRVNVDAYSLRKILTIHQQRSRAYIFMDEENIISFSVDEYFTNVLKTKANASSVDIGLVETTFTAADSAKRKVMQEIEDVIVKNLKLRFPELTQNEDSKYSILLDQLLAQIPDLPSHIKNGSIE